MSVGPGQYPQKGEPKAPQRGKQGQDCQGDNENTKGIRLQLTTTPQEPMAQVTIELQEVKVQDYIPHTEELHKKFLQMRLDGKPFGEYSKKLAKLRSL